MREAIYFPSRLKALTSVFVKSMFLPKVFSFESLMGNSSKQTTAHQQSKNPSGMTPGALWLMFNVQRSLSEQQLTICYTPTLRHLEVRTNTFLLVVAIHCADLCETLK